MLKKNDPDSEWYRAGYPVPIDKDIFSSLFCIDCIQSGQHLCKPFCCQLPNQRYRLCCRSCKPGERQHYDLGRRGFFNFVSRLICNDGTSFNAVCFKQAALYRYISCSITTASNSYENFTSKALTIFSFWYRYTRKKQDLQNNIPPGI